MKKTIIYVSVAILAGLGAGYLIFGDRSGKDSTEEHMHANEQGEVWTCSMHPQIRQPEPGQCPICGMDLIPSVTDGSEVGVNEIKMTKNAMALADIQTMVVSGNGEKSSAEIILSGKIKMNEETTAIQASYFDGRIEKLYVDFTGQQVRKGQLLATLYSPNLVAAQQELITASSLKESQPALYAAVRNKLKLWKLNEQQINAIETSGRVKEEFPVYAAVSGTVSEKLASEGDYVQQGQPILKVSNLGTVWADFDAYESQVANFKTGQKITVVPSAYPSKEIQATISFVDPILDTKTRTVTVRALLNNSDGTLKPGMFVKGKVQSGVTKPDGGVEIPASAVLWTGERSLVYIKTNPYEPVFEMREVVLGNRMGETYPVISGLESGEEIVIHGTFTVDAAAQLQGKRSMMNTTGGRTSTGHDHGVMKGSMGSNSPLLTEESQAEANTLIASYMELKDALVNSDPAKVKEYSERALEKLITLRNKSGKESQPFYESLQKNLDGMIKSPDLKAQRDTFVVLSEQMIRVAMEIKDKSQDLFVQYCPMANQDRGAQWLSWEKEIRNPYYGDAMLTCGEVRRKF
ncbi:efflux RND transporter periplasmic adaptor subunit [Muriicola marianensis]|uniref:Cation transporter n=1 Tax=Muriicola marianensis TaxID=1324801 RepID=A0ABQ1R8H4_9FLAO|nr:efflux RND transporter periplasmic adaptor subunit [Muriicola marianensis]GGD58216.1 cation transporter [Muriicola marianensis]